ncbi:peptide/nickel transport system permease protein [Methanobrevibacter gottschalkii]|uniref:Peptide/nickel transport system permease protein n=1 Tax=Methanobrevibacter gottschalkii TaxID=190974 RepID=A0A1H7J6P9_9EURY|nr:ABC transporter permease [Methanobrevibacter gottschalkii]MCQ2971006.1 ABC transporter permease [archaeon]SEK70411.1 peptide/nickel transport system permease protein [Methanobrevibacter gottschalkii]
MDSYMMRFVRNKIIHFIVLMVAVSIFSFILLDLSPIDPVNLYLKQSPITPAQRALLEQYWGVGQPITTKLFNWFTNFIQGNLGNSLIFRKPVVDVILEKFAASLVLMFLSWVVSGVLGFILGVLAGKNKGSWIDKCIRVYCYILQSAPTFWVALLVLVVFSIELGWFPVGLGVPIGVSSSNVNIWQWIARLVLPTLTLSMVGVAPITLYTRNELLNVLSSDYVLFARSRGESGWDLIERHGIRNILLPALTLQFLNFSELFGGAVLVEQVFLYPGIGQTAVAAGLQSDVPLLLGIVVISAVFVFVGNLIADILYYFVDPRIKENEI